MLMLTVSVRARQTCFRVKGSLLVFSSSLRSALCWGSSPCLRFRNTPHSPFESSSSLPQVPAAFASAGTFTSHHLIGELFKVTAGIEAVHVPFKGAQPGLLSVISGQADFAFAGFSGLSGYLQGGQLREIASTGRQRNPASPLLPTVGETLPGFAAFSWFAMWTRAEVPAAIREQIWREVSAAMKLPSTVQKVSGNGMTAIGSTPEELRMHLDTEQRKWASLPEAVLAAK